MKPTIARRKLTLGKERLRDLDTIGLAGIRGGGNNQSNAACTQTCNNCDIGTENTKKVSCPP